MVSYYCRKDNLILCSKCKSALHQKCNPELLCKVEHLQDDLEVTEKTIKNIMDYVKMTQIEDVIQNFRPQMLLFSSELCILKDTIEKSIEADIFTEYSALQSQLNKLLNKITDNEVFYEYAKDKAMRPLSGANYSFEVDYSEKSEKFFKALSSASDAIKERYDEKKKEEIKVFHVECREQLKQEFKHQLEQMAQKITDTEEDVKQEKELKKQVEDQLESINAERIHLKTEFENLMNLYNEEKKTKTQEKEERKEINQELVQEAYFSATNEYQVFDKNFYLNLDCNKKNVYNFMNKVRYSKEVLPDIKRIEIKNCRHEDLNLKEFLSTCFPHHLELLYFYFNSENLDFYKEVLQQILPKITREVYLCGCTFSKECFEIIVKASSKCQRLVFNQCVLYSDDELDFEGPEYNIYFFGLSFINNPSHRITKDADIKFENIVKAIKQSGLKDSLEQIDISLCGIGKENAQEVLNSYGFMDVIEAVATNKAPLTS
jgi:hypothetical protein